jgi:NAD(P)-dependent dehydrogenase (short-subunit alcohol dehydrogenase family)
MGIEAFRYDGKRALVVGGATGMGAATGRLVGELGGEVTVMDCAEVRYPVAQALALDLRDRTSIDDALDRLDGPVDALFSCAGVADGSPGLMQVNFIGQRYLMERLVDDDRMPRGSAMAIISSTAGLQWEKNTDALTELLDVPGYDESVAWVESHPDAETYVFSKQAVCAYVARRALPLLQRGIRINATQPGPTDTPLSRANADVWLTAGNDYRNTVGVEVARADEQAHVLVFLCSDAASYVTGISVVVDAGRTSARRMHGFEPRVVG